MLFNPVALTSTASDLATEDLDGQRMYARIFSAHSPFACDSNPCIGRRYVGITRVTCV